MSRSVSSSRFCRLLLMALVLRADLSHNLHYSSKPHCVIQDNVGMEIPCNVSGPTDHQSYIHNLYMSPTAEELSEGTKILPTGETLTYINVSIRYKRSTELDEKVLLVSYSGLRSNASSAEWWEVESGHQEKVRVPALLNVSFLPVLPTHTNIEIRMLVSDSAPKHFQGGDKLCSSEPLKGDCDYMMHNGVAVIFAPYPLKKQIELKISKGDEPYRRNLKVELAKGLCNILCVGGIYNCDVTITTHKWTNTSNELIFNDLEPAYYCAMVRPEGHDCCKRCTPTIQLIRDHEPEESISVGVNAWAYVLYYFLSITLIALLMVLIYSRRKYIEEVYREWKEPTRLEPTNENLIKMEDTLAVTSPNPPEHPPAKPKQVFLLYARESTEFLKLMDSFRRILSTYMIVYDPFDEAEMETVSANPTAWVEELIQNEDLRFILVETECGIEREKVLNKGQEMINHPLDTVFTYALSCLRYSPSLCHNYNRLFIIRFSQPQNNGYTNIVTCTRYQMPDHLVHLIMDINGTYGNSSENRSSYKPVDTHDLRVAMNTYFNSTS